MIIEQKDIFNQQRIAVLITSFNRLNITKKCIDRLFTFNYNFDVYLVDDGSTDGTYEFVSKNYPQINLIKGNGNLFWNRGMHLAWQYAGKNDYDYYLWLNDDILLYENAFEEVFECSKSKSEKAIIAGYIETPDKSRVLYGGYDKDNKKILPNGKMQQIRFMNGNFILVPRFVFEKIGNLDPYFHHHLGDIDYGLRAYKAGIEVFSTNYPIASGEINSICRERLKNSNIIKRFKWLFSPLGANPYNVFYFRKKYKSKMNAIFYFSYQILSTILPDSFYFILSKFRKL